MEKQPFQENRLSRIIRQFPTTDMSEETIRDSLQLVIEQVTDGSDFAELKLNLASFYLSKRQYGSAARTFADLLKLTNSSRTKREEEIRLISLVQLAEIHWMFGDLIRLHAWVRGGNTTIVGWQQAEVFDNPMPQFPEVVPEISSDDEMMILKKIDLDVGTFKNLGLPHRLYIDVFGDGSRLVKSLTFANKLRSREGLPRLDSSKWS